MNEHRYQVYRISSLGELTLLASDMLYYDAILFIKALFDKYYNESALRIEIRRPLREENDVDNSI